MRCASRAAWPVQAALCLVCAMAGAQTALQVCPADHAPASSAHAELVYPDGTSRRAVVTGSAPGPGCAVLELGEAGAQVLAVRPISRAMARAVGNGLAVIGQQQQTSFAISEVIPRTPLVIPVVATRVPFPTRQAPPGTGSIPPRATWIWQAQAWRDTPLSVLALARRYNIRTLYITVPLRDGVVQDAAGLAGFVRSAGAAGVAVWAVDGDPQMVVPSAHASAAARASAYVRYNRQAKPPDRLTGLQFDVEPYLLPGYDLAYEVWEKHYVALVAALHTAADGMPLDMLAPFWWGEKTGLLDAIAPYADSLTVMDYRSQVDEIARFAQPFLDWGSQHGKGVRIALEAGPIAPHMVRYFDPQPTGELWHVALDGQDFLLLLASPAPNPQGTAFRQAGSTTRTGEATTFHGRQPQLLQVLPQLEAQFSAWPAFSGMALHEIQ